MIRHKRHGFTLIELSIVLVIIGLIVGGVLAGQALIKASELRAVISQVDQFKIATNTFKNKYGALPGDMLPSKAAQLGFFEMGGANVGASMEGNGFIGSGDYGWITLGFGNNDRMIQSAPQLDFGCTSECSIFWRHLSEAGIMAAVSDVSLEWDTTLLSSGNGIYIVGTPSGEDDVTPFSSHLYLPAAKNGAGYFGVSSVSNLYSLIQTGVGSNQNFFYIAPAASAELASATVPSMSGMNTYAIDAKIDDGKPNSGKFLVYVQSFVAQTYPPFFWSDGSGLTADSIKCTVGGVDGFDSGVRYNTNPATGGNTISCMPIFVW